MSTPNDVLRVLVGSLTPTTLAAVLADLKERPATSELQVLQRAFADQLVALAGDDAAELLKPEFRSSPAGRMKVQWV
jgi:hypothetical protein